MLKYFELLNLLYGFLGLTAFTSLGFAEDGGGAEDEQSEDEKNEGEVDEADEVVEDDEADVMTGEQFKALMQTRDRKSKEQIDKLTKGYDETMKQLRAELSKLTTKKEDGETATKKKMQTPEYLDLQQKYTDNQRKLSELSKKNDELREKERTFRFETIVKNALATQGCTKIDMAYRMIAPDLTLDEAGKRVFITVDTPSGDVDLDAHQYVKQYVAQSVLPEFFNGKAKSGSAASGGRSGSSDYDFTMDQIKDAAFYKANHEAIEVAMDAGRIKLS